MSSMLLITVGALLGQYGSVDTVEGFTEDGAYLVGSTHDSSVFEGDRTSSWYQSTVTGGVTTFEADQDAEFKAWRAAHPIGSAPIAGRTSPDGRITIDVVLERGGATSDGWSADSTWRVLARWKDHTRFLTTLAHNATCEVSWAPDSRAVLLRTRSSGTVSGIRGAVFPTENDSVELRPLGVPVINVAGLDPTTAAKVIKKLPAGPRYVPSTAVKKRPATVVYFAKGQEPRARGLLPQLPGATLKPMDWDAPYDVVVALGGP